MLDKSVQNTFQHREKKKKKTCPCSPSYKVTFHWLSRSENWAHVKQSSHTWFHAQTISKLGKIAEILAEGLHTAVIHPFGLFSTLPPPPTPTCICSTWKRRRPPLYRMGKQATSRSWLGWYTHSCAQPWQDLELVGQGTVMKRRKGTSAGGCSCQEPPLQSPGGGLTLQVQCIQSTHTGLVHAAQYVLEIHILMDWQLADGRRPSSRNRHVGLGTWNTPSSQGWPHQGRHLTLNAYIWETPLNSHLTGWSQGRQGILQRCRHLHRLGWTARQFSLTVLATSPLANRSLGTLLIWRPLNL